MTNKNFMPKCILQDNSKVYINDFLLNILNIQSNVIFEFEGVKFDVNPLKAIYYKNKYGIENYTKITKMSLNSIKELRVFIAKTEFFITEIIL